MNNLGGKLAWFDRLARALGGIGLIIGAGLGGWSDWATVAAAATGGILVFEAVINYCPLAKILPWNR
jgi:isocitrate dehydrogenase